MVILDLAGLERRSVAPRFFYDYRSLARLFDGSVEHPESFLLFPSAATDDSAFSSSACLVPEQVVSPAVLRCLRKYVSSYRDSPGVNGRADDEAAVGAGSD